jgi:ketosteroid isomerase-like protein
MDDRWDDPKSRAALEVGERLIWVVEHGDLEELRQVFTEDAEIWHNTDDTVIGVDQTIHNIRAFTTAAAEYAYVDVRREPTPSGYVQQHVLTVKTPDGREIRDMCACVVRVENGRIKRFDAYHDSAAVPPVPGRQGRNWRTQMD